VAGTGKKHCDESLITALASGASVPAAAAHAGICQKTVRRRLADAAFRAKVDEARAALVSAAVGRLSAVGVLAVDKVHELASNARSETVQLGAARTALEFMFRGTEVDVLAKQIAELREQVTAILDRQKGP
jgi:hypothetical protein